MSKTAHVDFETRSVVDINECGAYVYAQHSSTEAHCMSYAIGDGEVKRWVPGAPFPDDLREHITAGGLITAHNANFERCIWRYVMQPRLGWPAVPETQWRCTMAKGYAQALPGKLEHLGPALGTGFEKDMTGHRLMLAMSRPRKPKKGESAGEILWREAPEDIERLCLYCDRDIEAERAANARLVALRPFEQRLWHLDQEINDRGAQVDVDLAKRNRAIVKAHSDSLDKELAQVTDYEVTACSNVNQLKAFLKRWDVFDGLDSDSLAKGVVEDLLARSDLDPRARRALEIRQEGGKASVDKIDALLNGLSPDGRARGLLQWHAASTGRWAGRRFQPQNILKPDEEFDVDGAINVIQSNSTEKALRLLDAMYGDPITCVSYTLRGMICAAKGKKIAAADLSNIEGRVLAWLAGEDWKVKYFADFDAGKAPDAYIKAYCEAFNVPVFPKKDPRRQVGKVMELASGFQGSHGAYLKMIPSAEALASLVAAVKEATPSHVWAEEADRFEGQLGLTCDQWTAISILVKRWRGAHPKTKDFWDGAERAALAAIDQPGSVQACGRVAYKVSGSFLWCRLPSGRALSYPYPKIMPVKTPWGATKESVTFKTVPNVSNRKKIIWDDKTNTTKWARISTYGGSLVENITQAVARDVLAEAMFRLDAAGYPLILTVHDEAVSEVDEGFGSVKEYEAIMSELPAWAGGLPVAASGFEAERYRK